MSKTSTSPQEKTPPLPVDLGLETGTDLVFSDLSCSNPYRPAVLVPSALPLLLIRRASSQFSLVIIPPAAMNPLFREESYRRNTGNRRHGGTRGFGRLRRPPICSRKGFPPTVGTSLCSVPGLCHRSIRHLRTNCTTRFWIACPICRPLWQRRHRRQNGNGR